MKTSIFRFRPDALDKKKSAQSVHYELLKYHLLFLLLSPSTPDSHIYYRSLRTLLKSQTHGV